MSERPNEPSGLTPGDPLGGGEGPAQEPGVAGYAPPAPGQGYTSPPPPGALAGATAAGLPAAGRYTLASWWSRVGAHLIDGIILIVGSILLLILFGGIFSVGFLASEEAGIASVVIGLLLAVLSFTIMALLYAPLMMARTNGRTLGRMALGIRVVRANGAPITFGYAMLREVAVKALLFGIAGSITFGIAQLADWLWPLWDDENRALHDFIVDSRVVQD